MTTDETVQIVVFQNSVPRPCLQLQIKGDVRLGTGILKQSKQVKSDVNAVNF